MGSSGAGFLCCSARGARAAGLMCMASNCSVYEGWLARSHGRFRSMFVGVRIRNCPYLSHNPSSPQRPPVAPRGVDPPRTRDQAPLDSAAVRGMWCFAPE